MNPKLLCRFACRQYKEGCPHAATENTTIDEIKTTGVNCDNLELNEHNGIDVPAPYVFFNDKNELGLYIHYQKELKDGDIKQVYELVCRDPTWLQNTFVNPLTQQHFVELCYMYRGTVISQLVSKRSVLTTIGLKELTSLGLNVPEKKTYPLTDYFSTYIHKSTTLSELSIYSRFGWSIDDSLFILGKTAISKDSITMTYLTQDIAPETVLALEPKGSPAGWLDATGGLLQYDAVRFTCYATITPLILRMMGGASFVFELVGDTSLGKTIMAQLAMSIYGNPQQLKMATSATKVFIERTCTTCNDLPVFLDETSMMPPDILSEVAYLIANERSRGRGKKEGGVEKVESWKSMLLTTGEVPLLSSGSLGGQEVRVVSLYGGIGENDPENVEYFKDRMGANFGVIAPLLIQKIYCNRDGFKEKYTQIRDKLKEYGKSDKTNAMGRVADTYALIAIAGFIFESVLEDLGVETKNPFELVKGNYCDRILQNDGSLSDRAYAIICDWIMENNLNFCKDKYGEAGIKYKLFGNLSMQWQSDEAPYDYADIIPAKLSEVLDKKLNHPGITKRILREWKDSGRIVCGKDGRTTIQATINEGDKQTRVIRLKMQNTSEMI